MIDWFMQEQLPLSILKLQMQMIARAVAYCHQCNIAHCDIKPANFMLSTTYLQYLSTSAWQTYLGIQKLVALEAQEVINLLRLQISGAKWIILNLREQIVGVLVSRSIRCYSRGFHFLPIPNGRSLRHYLRLTSSSWRHIESVLNLWDMSWKEQRT